MRRVTWILGIGAACTALMMACGATDNEQTSTNSSSGAGAGTNTGGAAQGGAGGVGVTVGNGGGLTVGAGGGCEKGCTADLKTVVDCNGVLVETCPGDQACLNGQCSNDPCGAAEASKSSYGCDYWALQPDIIAEGNGACFAAYVANTWSSPVHIDLFRDGTQFTDTSFIKIPQGQGQGLTYADYDAANGLPPGEVAIVFLAHNTTTFLPLCPIPNPAVIANISVQGTGRGSAFNIVTDRPVVAYSIFPYGGGPSAATSASLLLPTSAWDDNYIAVNAYEKSVVVQPAQPSLDVLAYQANTQVTILPKAAIVGGPGVMASAANTPVTYTLNAGEYVQISQDVELTGSVISADKPIGVWGAASCLNVPATATACDSAHQQIPPVNALGSRYAGVRYRNRASSPAEEFPPWRLVGAVDGTQLTWTPSVPTGAPTTLNEGDVAEFLFDGPFLVESQDADHPFYAAQYMTGADHVGFGEGDPEWVNMIPIDQFLDSYVFFTDPTYSETSLVVTRRRSTVSGNFEEVNLDCAGAITGWTALGADLEWTRVDLVTGNFQNVGNCSNGRHEMDSSAPFGVTVWGWGTPGAIPSTTYVSYAYPAGASVQPINEVEIPPIPN